MEYSWMVEEVKKIKNSKDVVILEKPDTKTSLDDMLIKKYWPVIEDSLKNTGYIYSPKDIPETEFEFSFELTRSLTFMLFDYESMIFRGKLCFSVTHWMLESEFFLQLSEENDPEVIFDIIGNPKFRGFPPMLEIHKDMPYIYQILFHSGKGTDRGFYDDDIIYKKIDEVIDVNARLYEFSIDGYILKEDVEEFLQLAYKAYEAY